MKKLAVIYSINTLFVSIIFLGLFFWSGYYSFLDFIGWVYFILSSISQAAQFMLIPLLLSLPFSYLKKAPLSLSLILFTVIALGLDLFLILDCFVFNLYRFHINGFIISMVKNDRFGQIFTLDLFVYLMIVIIIIFVLSILITFYFASFKLSKKKLLSNLQLFLILFFITLMAQGMHIYGAAISKLSILKSTEVLPYYYPMSATTILVKLGLVDSYSVNDVSDEKAGIHYPLNTLKKKEVNTPPNIVMIFIDSWNSRTFNTDVTPNICQFAQKAENYTSHLSSSNGTMGSIFGVFTGISSYYWEAFDASDKSPVLVSRLKELNYDIQLYPSASLCNPPFNKVLFHEFQTFRVETPGETNFERDSLITKDFIHYIEKRDSKQPLFSFLFYDLPHSFRLTKEQNQKFQPAWNYANYVGLNNETDPTPFFNLYKNTVYHDDIFIGEVLSSLETNNLLNNTIVIITGDHSQEFNENHKNFWGHNGNYSDAQIKIPFIFYYPGNIPSIKNYRTTHYDISATLLNQYLGIENAIEDYSMGHLLSDSCSRDWHLVGSHNNFAFVRYNQILERRISGFFELTDTHLNLLPNSQLDVVGLDKALRGINRYYK